MYSSLFLGRQFARSFEPSAVRSSLFTKDSPTSVLTKDSGLAKDSAAFTTSRLAKDSVIFTTSRLAMDSDDRSQNSPSSGFSRNPFTFAASHRTRVAGDLTTPSIAGPDSIFSASCSGSSMMGAFTTSPSSSDLTSRSAFAAHKAQKMREYRQRLKHHDPEHYHLIKMRHREGMRRLRAKKKQERQQWQLDLPPHQDEAP
ncbi:hypothetical protein V1264_013645 [Littorina saxatilis]|uniref:Uncharacterized protein n=1 Tax=Littorina saxatilis TaxID=31220 RepID=A0AAN9BR56_9CAEN